MQKIRSKVIKKLLAKLTTLLASFDVYCFLCCVVMHFDLGRWHHLVLEFKGDTILGGAKY